MEELKCKHCGRAVKFESRDEAGGSGWQLIAFQRLEGETLVAGGTAAFCPQTPQAEITTFIEAVASAVVEGRILE